MYSGAGRVRDLGVNQLAATCGEEEAGDVAQQLLLSLLQSKCDVVMEIAGRAVNIQRQALREYQAD